MNYTNITTYGKKSLISKLLTKKKGYLKLGVPIIDDWNEGY